MTPVTIPVFRSSDGRVITATILAALVDEATLEDVVAYGLDGAAAYVGAAMVQSDDAEVQWDLVANDEIEAPTMYRVSIRSDGALPVPPYYTRLETSVIPLPLWVWVGVWSDAYRQIYARRLVDGEWAWVPITDNVVDVPAGALYPDVATLTMAPPDVPTDGRLYARRVVGGVGEWVDVTYSLVDPPVADVPPESVLPEPDAYGEPPDNGRLHALRIADGAPIWADIQDSLIDPP